MADDLGSESDTTFRPGGALDKISGLAKSWEARARKAERARRAQMLERVAWGLAGAGIVTAVRHFFHV
jgi:hypothetical protein